MKQFASILCAVALVVGFTGLVLADEPRTLQGEYVWDARGDGGDLEAVFTPRGENAWDVAFHFTFRDQAHVYSGTAEGTLADGTLKGSVQNESKARTFIFEGKIADGEFRGTHSETTAGRERETGTLKLKI